MTPSQAKAIETQKRIMQTAFGDCEFEVYTPKHTNLLRLVCTYKIKNMLGDYITKSKGWTVGKRGKLIESQNTKLSR